jgi:hypothetical protein
MLTVPFFALMELLVQLVLVAAYSLARATARDGTIRSSVGFS